MTDYFTELEDQLGRATERGVRNRHPLANRLPRVTARVLAISAFALVVGVIFAALLSGGGGRSFRADHPTVPGSAGRPMRGSAAATIRGGGGYCVNSRTRKRTSCSPSPPASPRVGRGFPSPFSSRAGSPIRLVAQLYLPAPSGARRPTGVGRVLEQRGALGISILGLGLPANTTRNAYAVWLTNGLGDARLLGFVNPGVKSDGKLRTAGLLPKHAFRYRELLITLETQHAPKNPGTIVLKGAVHR